MAHNVGRNWTLNSKKKHSIRKKKEKEMPKNTWKSIQFIFQDNIIFVQEQKLKNRMENLRKIPKAIDGMTE